MNELFVVNVKFSTQTKRRQITHIDKMGKIKDLPSLDAYIKEQANKDFIYFSDIPEICKSEPW